MSQSPLTLLLCSLGICASYLYYGMLQEQLFANARIGASFLLVTQCVTNTLVALIWQHISNVLTKNKTPTKHRRLHHPLLILTAFCYCVAMTASNESLKYVSYPTAVLAKSSKLIPTMMLGSLIERRQYSRQEWSAAACITSGVVFFNLSRSQTSASQSNSLYGILLLILSLFFDGMLGACQGLLKSSAKDNNAYYRPPTATETMLSVNLYATVFLFPLSVYTREWSQGIELIRQASSFEHDILWLNAAAASGQIFIFVTITRYSSLVCTTITTTRKFFTILLSVVYFGHRFTAVQWGCVGLVFCGLYMGIVARIEKRHKKE